MNVVEPKIDNNPYIIKNISIDDCDYTIYINPVRVGGRKYGDYWCLARALLERITTEQLNRIYIQTKKHKKLILFNELVNCFKYDGDDSIYERNCICSVHIENVYIVRNLEKELEDGRLQLYPIGCVCIKNWKDFAAIDKQGRLDKKILEYKYKNDEPNTIRCGFCYRKNDKTKCKSCEFRIICKTIFDILFINAEPKRQQKRIDAMNERNRRMAELFKRDCEDVKLISAQNNIPNTCSDCDKPIADEYLKCYLCKFQSKCSVCNAPIDKKIYKVLHL